jgi:hypothetical protein
MAEKWLPVRDLDVFFLSFDEADADAHFADLRQKHPAAKRIHGVKGFDRAHKAAASDSRTEHFVTIDADNIVDPAFFELSLDRAVLQPRTIVSWPARNAVNGIVSGNGAVKCWPRGFVLDMRTHENATGDEGRVDFVYNTDLDKADGSIPWDEPAPMSTVYGNATPVQAFRAGFRAASRLTLVNGRPCLVSPGIEAIWLTNLQRLDLWLNVGADAPNGLWTLYGARLGCWLVNFAELNITVINNLAWFDDYFRTELEPQFDPAATTTGAPDPRLAAAVAEVGDKLGRRSGLRIVELGPPESALFKRLYQPPLLTGLDRMGTMLRRGIGVGRDPTMAAAYYRAAAAHGERNAIHNLARLSLLGQGLPRDYRHGLALLREAAALGDPYAQERLAGLYLQGMGFGIERDPAEALRLLEAACDAGLWRAGEAAARLRREAPTDGQDAARALLYMTFASFVDAETLPELTILRAAVAEAGVEAGADAEGRPPC